MRSQQSNHDYVIIFTLHFCTNKFEHRAAANYLEECTNQKNNDLRHSQMVHSTRQQQHFCYQYPQEIEKSQRRFHRTPTGTFQLIPKRLCFHLLFFTPCWRYSKQLDNIPVHRQHLKSLTYFQIQITSICLHPMNSVEWSERTMQTTWRRASHAFIKQIWQSYALDAFGLHSRPW